MLNRKLKSFVLFGAFVVLGIGCLTMASGASRAAGDVVHPPHQHWHFDGMFGVYDRAALQRGFKVYKQVCASCHAMKYMSYRNLSAIGYNDAEIKAIAAEYTVMDGPNDEGEMFERPAKPSDAFVSPYPNRQAAMYANNGAYPPDMSLLAQARAGGADYIYALLTGYHEAPSEMTLLDGQYWNKYMPGHVIAMAPPLSDGIIAYEDGSPETISQYSKDLAEFLTWASAPDLEDRKRIGFKVLIFLIVFAGVMYATKKKIWKDQH